MISNFPTPTKKPLFSDPTSGVWLRVPSIRLYIMPWASGYLTAGSCLETEGDLGQAESRHAKLFPARLREIE